MAKEDGVEATATKDVAPEAEAIDYSTKSKDELLELIGQAYKEKQMKLMGKLSLLYTKAEAAEEKSKKDALLAELIAVTQETSEGIDAFVESLVVAGKLEGADGVWFALDFGAIREKGINPSCRLIKTTRKAAGEGSSTGKSSYVANPAKSAELLEKVGGNVMFSEETLVTIDKVEQTMAAGTTFKAAYDYSTNGGWRNRVRMALLKEAGVI
jgi:hypothetical protein